LAYIQVYMVSNVGITINKHALYSELETANCTIDCSWGWRHRPVRMVWGWGCLLQG